MEFLTIMKSLDEKENTSHSSEIAHRGRVEMKKLRFFGSLVVFLLLSQALIAFPARAQMAQEQWNNGVRYLYIYNTTQIILNCGMVASNGSWFWHTLTPGQFMYKAVHPSNYAQWYCVPV